MSIVEHSDRALERLSAARGFIFDMDGTLVLGDRNNKGLQPLPGGLEVIRHLHAAGTPYVIFTNGTTRPPHTYAQTLRDLGFPVDDAQMFTPVTSAVEVLQLGGHQSVMVLGGEGMTGPLEEAGFTVVDRVAGSGADAVLAGWFRDMRFEDIEAACDAVWGGAAFYSASSSRFFATSQGNVLGTSRVLSAAVSDITGCTVEVVGKPSRLALTAAAHRLGVEPADVAVVGDDPELEMAMARASGALAVFVGSGVRGDVEGLPESEHPDIVLESVGDLMEVL